MTLPEWNGKFWAGSSEDRAVVRSQEQKLIRCDSPQFDDMVCMSYKDLSCFYQTYVMNCQQWADPKPTCKEIDVEDVKALVNAITP